MLDFTVTGASGNLGSAIAQILARQGTLLALANMRQRMLERTVSDVHGLGHLTIAGADVRTREGTARIVAETLARFGRIDALANNVGTFKTTAVADGAADDWSLLTDLSLRC